MSLQYFQLKALSYLNDTEIFLLLMFFFESEQLGQFLL